MESGRCGDVGIICFSESAFVGIFGNLGMFGVSSQQQTDTQERMEERQPGAGDEWRGSAEDEGGGSGFEGEHDSELASVKPLRREGGELEERKNEPGSLLWRVFIQSPLVSYQLKGLGDCFSTILPASLPPSLLCSICLCACLPSLLQRLLHLQFLTYKYLTVHHVFFYLLDSPVRQCQTRTFDV